MEYFTTAKEILLLDGRQLVSEIRAKPKEQRKWWEKIYLWFHDNFEMVMIIGGCILLALLIYTYLDDQSGCSDTRIKSKIQHGGEPGDGNQSTESSSNSSNVATEGNPISTAGNTKAPAGNTKTSARNTKAPTGATSVADTTTIEFRPKSEIELKAQARVDAAKKKAEDILAGRAEPEKTTNQKMKAKFLSGRAEKNITKAKEAIKGMPGKAFGAVAGKSVAAWQSVKSGEALELGKEKFENVLSNAGDFAKQHAKAGYALAFTTFMVIGFGLFFVPTLVMFVIGAITLIIFNKQKMKFFENI